MLAIILCFLCFGLCYWFGRRSLAQGLIALLAVGYFYGIVRANVLTTFSHFLFDAGLTGIYVARLWDSSQPKNSTLRIWMTLLIAWPMLLCLMPFQPLMVSLVGLRGNVFFLPMLLLGSRLRDKDLIQISMGMAVLNLISLGFAGAEYFTSLERFYPVSPVTNIIYNSADVEGGFFRIPAIFTSAHAYGGAMTATLPLLIAAWIWTRERRIQLMAGLGMGAALLGILLSATRLNFVLACGCILTIFFAGRMKPGVRIVFLLLIAAVGFSAISNVRFSRFKSLADTDSVAERIAGSVNRGFWEILVDYPMGNGLGGGGTSIPYFLQSQVRNPIGLESEYSRILCEQGVLGLLVWISFIIWVFSRIPGAFMKSPWQGGRRLAICLCLVQFAIGLVGTGLLTSIPGTMLFLLNLGWAVSPVPRESKVASESRVPQPAVVWPHRYGHAS